MAPSEGCFWKLSSSLPTSLDLRGLRQVDAGFLFPTKVSLYIRSFGYLDLSFDVFQAVRFGYSHLKKKVLIPALDTSGRSPRKRCCKTLRFQNFMRPYHTALSEVFGLSRPMFLVISLRYYSL